MKTLTPKNTDQQLPVCHHNSQTTETTD